MPRKIKVVEVNDIETKDIPAIENTPLPPVEVEEAPQEEEIKETNPVVEAPQVESETDEPEPVIATTKTEQNTKTQEKITCQICNKTMLVKTYKYTHQKLCKSTEVIAPSPAEPKTKAKAEPKIKPEPKTRQVKKPESKHQIEIPASVASVSFNEFEEMHRVMSPLDIYRQAREQRQQAKIQRVKSLISQAV
jgi:hypothetical protein